jgi:hypothetical protein
MEHTPLTLVTVENLHVLVPTFIVDNKIMISDYEDMINVVLQMIKKRHFFNMDKNILRGFMEDLTFMYSPSDTVNKDRIVAILEPSDDEDDESMIQELSNYHDKHDKESC